MGIACNGRFIMTCSGKNDLVLWDLRGQELARVDTYLMNTICARISPCGRYIVASGIIPTVLNRFFYAPKIRVDERTRFATS